MTDEQAMAFRLHEPWLTLRSAIRYCANQMYDAGAAHDVKAEANHE